ncbi:MAG: hypothetical protein C4309_03485 [Chloroflexota bacterium]
MRRNTYRILQATETAIYLFAGFLIALGAVLLLGSTLWDGVRALLQRGYVAAAVGLLDRILLALMLAEILYTLVRFAREGGLQAEPFLLIGIIAAVRRMLVITAESVHKVDLKDPAFLNVLAELFVLAVSVLAFAWAIRLVRARA